MTLSKPLFALSITALLSGNLFSAAITQYLKIEVTDNSNLVVQQTTSFLMAFSANGTDALDANDIGNANSLGSLTEMVYPFSVSSDNNTITQEDARPTLDSYKRINFGFATKFPVTIKIYGSYFTNSTDSSNRPTYAWIEQISTGYRYSFMGDTVKLDLPANLDFVSDFYLHTGPMISKTVTNETCFNAIDGAIAISNPNIYNWNLTLLQNATVLFSTTVNQPDTTILNLATGYYTVMTSMNSIPVDSVEVFVDAPQEIIPDFTIDNYNPTTVDFVTFDNYTTGAITYSWDFGDGDYDSTENTSHQFLTAGNYGVVLTATNSAGCQETVYDSVFVTADIPQMHQGPNFMQSIQNNDATLNNTPTAFIFDPTIESTNSAVRISTNQIEEQTILISLLDTNGKLIKSITSAESNIELSVPQTGLYIVQIVNSKGEFKSKTIMVNN